MIEPAGDFDRLHYENAAYWDWYTTDPTEAARVAAIRAMIPPYAWSILDVGCGIGSLTNTIAAHRVVGVDLAQTPLRQVRADRAQASIAALPFRPGAFDLVIVTEVFEHLDDATFATGIAEIRRLMPRHILISTPFREDLTNEQVRCSDCGQVFNPYHHRRSLDLADFERALPGYDLVEIDHVTNLPTRCPTLTRIKRACGVYDRSSTAICDRCGAPAEDRAGPGYYLFGAIGRLLFHAKRRLGMTFPYHQVLLFERSDLFI